MIFIRGSGPAGSFYFWPIAGAVVGIYLFCHGFFLLQRKRLIMNTPVSKIRSAAMGLVEISGLANGPFTVTAPVTGQACYYCRTMVWEWKREGKNSNWVKSVDESLHVPFFLDDNTGRVLVDPQGAEMEIHRDFHDEFNQGFLGNNFGMLPNVSSFLASRGISSDERVKVEEYCIKPKNALFVLGTLAHNPGITISGTPVRNAPPSINLVGKIPAGGFGRAIGAVAPGGGIPMSGNFTIKTVQAGTSSTATVRYNDGKPHPMTADDQAKIAAVLTKAGISNPAAWAAAGISPTATPVVAAPTSGAAAAAPALEPFDLHPPTVLMQGVHDRAFFISWRSQRDVISALGWKSALMIWGGPALTLVSVYIFAALIGWL